VKRRVLVIGLLVVGVLASLLGYGLHRRPRTAGVAAPADSARAGVKTVRLYFGAVSGDSLVSEARELAEAASRTRRRGAARGHFGAPRLPG
jgi:hypothetical protein